MASRHRPDSIIRLFEKTAIREDGCWLWHGLLDRDGYGDIYAKINAVILRRAHRLAWWLMVGPIPKGLTIDHLCRRRNCINPDHMELVTPEENVRRGDHYQNNANAAKTHCKRGHQLSGENLYVMIHGGRQCRACVNDSHRATYQRKRAAGLSWAEARGRSL